MTNIIKEINNQYDELVGEWKEEQDFEDIKKFMNESIERVLLEVFSIGSYGYVEQTNAINEILNELNKQDD